MKYLVLKKSGIDRKMRTHDSTMITKNGAETVIVSKYFLSGHSKKTRRFRSAFTTEQIKYLEKEFKKFPYIGSGNRKEVSNTLNIPERAIKIWFQNRRMKEKKEVTNKETVDEEQKNINITRQGQTGIKNLNHNSVSTNLHTVGQSLKTTYPDPSIMKNNIKYLSNNKNICAPNESSKSIQDKPRITVKNFNNRNFSETNNSRMVNKAPLVPQQLNNETHVQMKMLENKNIYIKRLIKQEIPKNHKLEHGKARQEIPKDLTMENQSCQQVIHPNFYQINPNQEQRYMPLHVQALPQPPPFVPGNILWKPVNVMPVLPEISTSHQAVHSNSYPMMNTHPHFPKEDCKCNRNIYNTQDISSLMQVDGIHLPHQYILAMPFNHFDRI